MSAPVRQHDLGAERALLGAVLINSEAFWAPASDLVRAEHLYDPRHRAVWGACVELAKSGQPFDSLSVEGQLAQTKQIERAGGLEYVLGLTDTLPSDATVERNARRVRELAVVRKVLDAALRVAAEASEPIENLGDFLNRAETALGKACADRVNAQGASHVRDVVQEVYAQIIKQADDHKPMIGIATGLHDFDRVVSGAVPGEYVVIAARPGMGKSAFAQRLATGIAQTAPVYIASIEMSKLLWGRRILASESGVDGNAIRNAKLSKDSLDEIGRAAGRLERLPIYVLDNMQATILDIRREVRSLTRSVGKFGAVFIDYMQLVKPHDDFASREQEVAAISWACKEMTREFDCAVYALAQLNRAVDSRADKRPMLSDLRESGAIEQDADTVLFVYRDEVYDSESKEKGIAEIIIGKQRSGDTGMIKLAWDGARTRFDNLYVGGYDDN